MSAVDVAGFVAELKNHLIDHGFHIHDERHFIETYGLRQTWEIDTHPEAACGGPIDLRLSLDLEPRTLLAFQDELDQMDDDFVEPDAPFNAPLLFSWAMPPLASPPDLLVLTTDLAGVGGPELPLRVSALDSFTEVTDPPAHSVTVTSEVEVSLVDVLFAEQEQLCTVLERAEAVSRHLLEAAAGWMS